MDLWKAVQEMLSDYYDMCGRVDMASGKVAEIFPEIIAKASKDLGFREKILRAPVETLKRKGFRLPKGFNVKFIEETEDAIHIPLLPFVGDGLQTDGKVQLTKLNEIIQMATMDLDFRNQLIRNPEAVLKETGFEIDPSRRVVILECTDDLFYAVLPQVEKPNSDEPKAVELKSPEEAQKALVRAIPAIQKASSKRVIHRKTAARRISKLTRSVNTLSAKV